MPDNLGPDEYELLARLSHRYYLDGRTQEELGREFGLSRQKVQRLLERARWAGVVDIHVEAPPWLHLDLEAQLCQAFGLEDAIVGQARVDQEAQR
ncbi:MAG: sugar-binding transcriptional regulator, partial [Chloroflexi bacterium]|nr:sugar-binding transcriptional regulator [Chloroflexota bacterium]